MNGLLALLLMALIINLIMFVPAFAYKTDKLTDASYSLSFIVLAIVAFIFSRKNLMQQILLVMVLSWALRLGVFLLIRIWNMKSDKRFDEMRDKFFVFMRFWLLQGVSVFIILISSLLLWQEQSPIMGTLSIIGVYVFASGLALETTADLQKYRFNKVSANKGKWIDEGLWSISRHPNYLGEMLVWVGIYLFVMPALNGNNWIIALASPVYICSLLLFVSGIPLLEKSADERWGNDAKYVAYKKRTSLLIPKIY